MYTLYTFCIHCAKYIVAAGVKRVIYAKVYRHAASMDYLRQAGIVVEEYHRHIDWDRRVVGTFSDDIVVKKPTEGDVTLKTV